MAFLNRISRDPASAGIRLRTLLLGVGSLLLASCGGSSDSSFEDGEVPPVLQSIAVVPAELELAAGGAEQLAALGTYSDGSEADLTNQVSWSSSDDSVAQISSSGEVNAGDPGEAIATASLDNVSGEGSIRVLSAVTVALQILPPRADIALDGTQRYSAFTVLSDGTVENVTFAAEWSLQNESGIIEPYEPPATRGIDDFGTVIGVEVGEDTLVANFAGLQSQSEVKVVAAELTQIVVSPFDEVIYAGGTVAYTVTGIYSNGTSADLTRRATYSSDNTTVATISNASVDRGLATGLSPGITSIRAQVQGFETATTLTVLDAPEEIVRIDVIPPTAVIGVNERLQYQAIAITSEGRSIDISADAGWQSGDTSVASVESGSGLATGVAVGVTSISATFQQMSGAATLEVFGGAPTLQSISVEPMLPMLPSLITQQFKAVGLYSDGSKRDLTNSALWQSSDTAVLVFSNLDEAGVGLAFTLSPGTSIASASFAGTSGSTEVTVLDEINPDAAVVVTPALSQIAVGTTQAYGAELIIPGLPAIVITADVTWESANESIAIIDSSGNAQALAAGQSTISATLAGEVDTRTASGPVLVGSAQLLVKTEPVTIVGLTISPPSADMQVTEVRQFQAIAELSDGSTLDVTQQSSWQIEAPQVAVVDNGGLVSAVAPGSTALFARLIGGSQNIEASAAITVRAPELVSVSVSPPAASTLVGTSVAFTATAAYADGSTEDVTGRAAWSSSDTNIATVDSGGSALGIAAGGTQISASLAGDSGPVAGSAMLTVVQSVPEKLPVGIVVAPEAATVTTGETLSFTATLLYNDGSQQDITASASWLSTDTAVAVIDSSGVATGLTAGRTTIKAQFNAEGSLFEDSSLLTVEEVLELTGLRIEPGSAQVLVTTSQQFRAFAQISNGTEREVTADASWTADPSSIAQVSPSGLATGLSPGLATVRAQFTYEDIAVAAEALLEVLPPAVEVERLEVTPADAALLPGGTQQYTATVFLSNDNSQDVTGDVSWQSADPAVATIVSGGLATAAGPGSTGITATLFYGSDEQLADTTNLIVDEIELVAIAVFPENASLPQGRQQTYSAIGRFNDGGSQELTTGVSWSTDDTAIVSIDNAGIATAESTGATKVVAASAGIVGSTKVTVTNKVIDDLQITPPTVSDPAITVGTLVATAHYSDQTTDDVTALADWQSDDPKTADVKQKPPKKGTYILRAPGATQISASFEGFTDTIPVNVENPVLEGILISPIDPEEPVGTMLQFAARGVFSDLTFPDLTDDALWKSSNPSVAAIDAETGAAQASSAGETTITATYGGFTGKTLFTVTPPVPTELTVTPPSFEDAAGTSEQFSASILFSNGSQRDFTNEVTWSSDADGIVSVGNGGTGACEPNVGPLGPSGCASLLAQGSATITATYDGLTDTATVVVNTPTIVDLFLTPYDETYPDGLLVNFTAIATYNNGGSIDVTADSVWHSLDGEIITADPLVPGQFYTVAQGSTDVTATFDGITESVPVTVRPAAAVALQVEPGSIRGSAGAQVQLEATAFYDNGTAEPVTDQTVWQSALETVATVDADGANQGLVKLIAQGTTAISADFGGLTQTVPVTVTPATLVRIEVQPASAELTLGSTLPYEAIGLYSDDSSALLPNAAWQSSNVNVATIDAGGVAHSKQIGDTTISASFQGVTGSTPLTVVDATVASLRVEPNANTGPAGTLSPVSAVAILTNNEQLDVTGIVTWGSASGFVATVSADPDANTAFVSYNNVGATQITATLGSGVDQIVAQASAETTAALLQRIELIPDPVSLPESELELVFATGFYSDSSTKLLNSTADWTAADPSVATVDQRGIVTGVAPGQQTTVTATVGDISGSAVVNVTEAQLLSIQITPGELLEPEGTSGNLRADGNYSNGESRNITGQVTWVSQDPAIAAVTSGGTDAGFLRLLAAGTTSVQASLDGITDQITVTVTEAELLEILVTPGYAEIPAGSQQDFSAEGRFSDGSFSPIDTDVTWTSSDPSIADIASSGVATGRQLGTVTISATEGEVVGNATLVVTSPEVQALQITPAGLVEPAGTSGQFDATAALSDATDEQVTEQASWISSNPAIVSVTNAPGAGVANLKTPGEAVITATYQGVEDSVTVTVTDAVLTAIRVLPSQAEVPDGVQVQYRAEGVFSDGAVTPIDGDVSWSSSIPAIATISGTGLADTLAAGATEIRAVVPQFPDVVGLASLTVTETAIEFITLTPAAPQTVLVGDSRSYEAKATLTNGSVLDVTDQSVWLVDQPAIASVEGKGLIKGLAEGAVVVTAQYDDERGQLAARSVLTANGDLTVAAPELISVEINTFRELGQPVTIPAGKTEQWQAFANFSDGSFTDITSSASWRSSQSGIATVVGGFVDAITAGVTEISISYCPQGTQVRSLSCSVPLTDTVSLEVTAAQLLSIVVSPATSTISVDGTTGYTAIGQYSDGNDQNLTATASWNTGNSAIAAYQGVSGTARILGVSEGATGVTATQNGITGTAEIIVDTVQPTALRIDNPVSELVIGSTWQYQAVATYEDQSEATVTVDSIWQSSNTAAAVVDQGLAETVGVGTTTITATFEGLSADTTLSVIECATSDPNGKPDIVLLVPENPVIADVGGQVQMQAIGIYNLGGEGECQNNISLDPQTNWKVTGQGGSNQVIEVNQTGLVTSLKCGNGVVEADHRGVKGEADVVVCPAQ